jgi:hypothetical protein
VKRNSDASVWIDKRLAGKMAQWSSGGPIATLSSYSLAGKPVSTETAEKARAGFEYLLADAKLGKYGWGPKDVRELQSFVRAINAGIKSASTRSNPRSYKAVTRDRTGWRASLKSGETGSTQKQWQWGLFDSPATERQAGKRKSGGRVLAKKNPAKLSPTQRRELRDIEHARGRHAVYPLERKHAALVKAGYLDCAPTGAKECWLRVTSAGEGALRGTRKKNPTKLTREQFEKRYWGAEAHTVPAMTRREFYSDYRESGQSFAAYKKSTSTPIDEYYGGRRAK